MKKTMLKRFKLTALSIATLSLFQGCMLPAMSDKPMSFKKDTAQGGMIFGSVTFSQQKARFNGYHLVLTALDEDKKEARKKSNGIHFTPDQGGWKMKHRGQADDGMTYIFAVERPAGNYEITGIGLFTNGPTPAMQSNSGRGGFSIPLEVKKGEITYVGNIQFNEYAVKGETAVSLGNTFERDIFVIKELQPGVSWWNAVNDKTRKIIYKEAN